MEEADTEEADTEEAKGEGEAGATTRRDLDHWIRSCLALLTEFLTLCMRRLLLFDRRMLR